jgi:HSP20 family molecular chaperone IbpA
MTVKSTEVQVQRHEQTRNLPALTPATDIYENDKEIVLLADMPGVRPEHIDVSLENRVLTISGRTSVEEPNGMELLYREFGPAEYRRSFTLTDEVDAAGISARIRNGRLRVALPKAPEAQPRRITVQSEP